MLVIETQLLIAGGFMAGVLVENPLIETINHSLQTIGDSQFLTVRQFCEIFPWPSESAMRSYIFRAEMLGISDAFVRVGRRVLIIPQRFFSLITQIEKPSNERKK